MHLLCLSLASCSDLRVCLPVWSNTKIYRFGSIGDFNRHKDNPNSYNTARGRTVVVFVVNAYRISSNARTRSVVTLVVSFLFHGYGQCCGGSRAKNSKRTIPREKLTMYRENILFLRN